MALSLSFSFFSRAIERVNGRTNEAANKTNPATNPPPNTPQSWSNPEGIELQLRRLLFFFSSSHDAKRLELLCKALTQNTCSAPANESYCHALLAGAGGGGSGERWLFQMARLCALVASVLAGGGDGTPPNLQLVMTLWCVLDDSRFGGPKAGGRRDGREGRGALDIPICEV